MTSKDDAKRGHVGPRTIRTTPTEADRTMTRTTARTSQARGVRLIRMHPTARKPRDEHGDQLGRFGLADVHMHTHFSDGTGSVEEVLAYVEQATPLDVIAITDHDTIEGALRAQELAAKRGY